MSKKIRLTRTIVMEYTPNPDNYPYCDTIEEMASLDASADDPELLFFDECESDVVIWEIIDDENEKVL